ncbi:MAG: hypothetical protein EA403_06190 [Spirochaetaceae bacterium]|nr:MAG: hypothetical protein EA403_06190 [Spirochaetaceae bacterium]
MYRTMRILESVCTFFFAGSLIVLTLYLLGNAQEFLEETQRLLLSLLRWTSLLSALSGLYYMVNLILWMVSRRRFLAVRFIYAATVMLVCTGILVAVTFVGAVFSPA